MQPVLARKESPSSRDLIGLDRALPSRYGFTNHRALDVTGSREDGDSLLLQSL